MSELDAQVKALKAQIQELVDVCDLLRIDLDALSDERDAAPKSLSSRPIKFVFAYEVDDFPDYPVDTRDFAERMKLAFTKAQHQIAPATRVDDGPKLPDFTNDLRHLHDELPTTDERPTVTIVKGGFSERMIVANASHDLASMEIRRRRANPCDHLWSRREGTDDEFWCVNCSAPPEPGTIIMTNKTNKTAKPRSLPPAFLGFAIGFLPGIAILLAAAVKGCP